jgi:LuxR family quorum sensing-dependent transcriptional regulator
MLALIEKFTPAIREAASDRDIVAIMGEVCVFLGFRSSFLIEYASGDMSKVLRSLDTNPNRLGWWQEYLASGLRSPAALAGLIERPNVSTFTAERFGPLDAPILAFAQRADIIDCTLVHISFGGQVVGMVGFSGPAVLSESARLGLQLLAYAVFAQTHSLEAPSAPPPPSVLTPREKQVIALSAQGFTSEEIAVKLGISPRTVNQHVDNVAEKLGTNNRAHTVAEVIRHNLLD